jgi:hypothetical protein
VKIDENRAGSGEFFSSLETSTKTLFCYETFENNSEKSSKSSPTLFHPFTLPQWILRRDFAGIKKIEVGIKFDKTLNKTLKLGFLTFGRNRG